ncbi:MAG TPA: GNAT family N-acetyltransferase [Acidimicrobiales bacterium]|nr:GNAT family N-acetyltransferase [Acidimicrobiales bacterium]
MSNAPRSSLELNEIGPMLQDRYAPWSYPDKIETDVVTRTGAVLHLRPIRSGDDEKLIVFHRHLSSDSIYRRYFSFHPDLSHEEVCRLTQVDYVDRLAIVIEDGDDLVAVGRYDRYPESTVAEVAFIVRDDYQHLGLGHRLLESLAAAAWARGVTSFSAETLFSNRDMMSVFRHSGFPLTSSVSQGEISVRFPIEPTPESVTLRSKYRAGTI